MDFSKHDFSSLSVRDLLEGREALHKHLAHLDTVYATAIGRYFIRDEDPNSKNPNDRSDPATLGPRTLENSSPQAWSWPCILVFVNRWITWDEIREDPSLAQKLVSSFYVLPDDRVIPTCVVLVDPGAVPPLHAEKIKFASDLCGGGFPVETTVQGRKHVGSIGCLVTDGDTTYALTNRHVAGEPGREIFAGFKNRRRLGVSHQLQLSKMPFSEVYPGWPGQDVMSNLDAGLVRIDDVKGWTAQVYGIGEIGPVWDLNASSFRLDIINCPLVGFGGAGGRMTGRILGLFYRYKTVGGVEYVSDFVIGRRPGSETMNNVPGNSGTLWFEDAKDPPRNASGAAILRPVAMEWGGQQLVASHGGTPLQLALGICLSTICRELDVEVIADWNTGHTEYWGAWGHVKIGAYAAGLIDATLPNLKKTLEANADNIGVDDAILKTVQKPSIVDGFSPLADVADLVWRNTRPNDESNHFADMDKPDSSGETLLQKCAADMKSVDPVVWNAYYEDIGERRRGALPFRVWQIFDEMVDFAKAGKVTEFVCAAGLVAHYVGDACQPLHISQYHHGQDPSDKKHGQVHSVYETAMVGRHGTELIDWIPKARIPAVAALKPAGAATGRNAAQAVVELMMRTVKRLPPLKIVEVFESHMGRGQDAAMWAELGKDTAACMQDGARTLARIWEAAWQAGQGERNTAAETLSHDALIALYTDKTFLPSWRLQDVHLDANDRIVGKAAASTSKARPKRTKP